jgi:hypothetical protein
VKPLLVGEMPSRASDRYYQFPLSGAVAQSLCQMAGISSQEDASRYSKWTWALYESFDAINAIERHGPWDSALAGERLAEKIESDREVVVLLGRRAHSAYVRMTAPAESNLTTLAWHEWGVDLLAPTARREVVVVPYPSALSRIYNEAAPRRRTGRVLREAIEKAHQLAETRL